MVFAEAIHTWAYHRRPGWLSYCSFLVDLEPTCSLTGRHKVKAGDGKALKCFSSHKPVSWSKAPLWVEYTQCPSLSLVLLLFFPPTALSPEHERGQRPVSPQYRLLFRTVAAPGWGPGTPVHLSLVTWNQLLRLESRKFSPCFAGHISISIMSTELYGEFHSQF